MTRRILILSGAVLLLGARGPAAIKRGNAPPLPVPFGVASVHFERNATDDDYEVVFEVKGGAEGLAQLAVVTPDGRPVINFTAPEASTLGIRQHRFESPEKGDVARMKAAYPEGVYTFTGATNDGNQLRSQSMLSHQLPPIASVMRPKNGAQGVATKGLEVAWSPVKGVVAYMITIEQTQLNVSIDARLPGSMTRFVVPDGFLRAGTEYTLAIGTVSEKGNVSFVETAFTTAGKE